MIGNSTISQAYDTNGDMTKYIDADGNTTSWQYNDDGQVTLQTAPIGNTTTSYNANDEASSVVDADGGTISDTFDGNGNITTETWILGGTIQQTANYSYNSVGELTYAANSAGTYTYQYNSLGQKTQQVWTDANGDALTLNYTYDSSGNLTLETDSQGNTLSFVYNGEGLMTTEIATSSTGTVARTQWSYNAEQQITQIQDYTVASAGTAVLTINNSYDINGNLTTETETGSGVSVTYINSYDADNRITSEVRNGVTVTYGYNAESEVTSAGSQTNSFDANGNLTNSGFSTGTYNEINTDGTWSYYYDGVGNMVEKINLSSSVTWNYAYDMDYQLTSAVETNAGGTVLQSGSYSYDVFNNLVAETITVSGVATTSKFAYDGSQIYADLSGTGTVQTLYVTGMSDGSGQLYARIQSGTLYWIVQDRQGSVREIINSSGSSILDAITYTDDGGIQSQTGSTYLGNYGYTGLRYDSLTTYWVAVNRWYDPATDQWLEVDPDGYAGGLSDLRDYVGNDWTNATDLSGLWSWKLGPKGELLAISETGDTLSSLVNQGYNKEELLKLAKGVKLNEKLATGTTINVTTYLPLFVQTVLSEQQQTPYTEQLKAALNRTNAFSAVPNVSSAMTLGELPLDLNFERGEKENGVAVTALKYFIFGDGNCYGFAALFLGQKYLPLANVNYKNYGLADSKKFNDFDFGITGPADKPGIEVSSNPSGEVLYENPGIGLLKVLTKGLSKTDNPSFGDLALFVGKSNKGFVHAAIVLGKDDSGIVYVIQKLNASEPYAVTPVTSPVLHSYGAPTYFGRTGK